MKLPKLKGSVLHSTWKTAKQNKLLIFSTMLFDAFFILCLYTLNRAMTQYFPQGVLVNAMTTVAVLPFVLLGYMVIVLLLYSFLKFFIMRNIVLAFEKKEFQWRRFWKWTIINIAVLSAYIVAFVFFAIIFVTTIRLEMLDTVRNFFLVVVGLFFYLSINTLHSRFAHGAEAGVAIKAAFWTPFNKLKAYFGLLLFTIVAGLCLTAAYYLFDKLILLILGSSAGSVVVVWIYKALSAIIAFTACFGLVAFNRAYFYNLLRTSKHL